MKKTSNKQENNKIQEKNKLLYEKANIYRLHADNLRWTLLGGYGVFYAAVATQLKDATFASPSLPTAVISLILFIVSILYLMILAIQNWYYNLFSDYVEDCEKKLIQGELLVPLAEYTVQERDGVKVRDIITPLHQSFSFALISIALTSISFLLPAVKFSLIIWFSRLAPTPDVLFAIGGSAIIIYLYIFVLLFRNWGTFTYPYIVEPITNLGPKQNK